MYRATTLEGLTRYSITVVRTTGARAHHAQVDFHRNLMVLTRAGVAEDWAADEHLLHCVVKYLLTDINACLSWRRAIKRHVKHQWSLQSWTSVDQTSPKHKITEAFRKNKTAVCMNKEETDGFLHRLLLKSGSVFESMRSSHKTMSDASATPLALTGSKVRTGRVWAGTSLCWSRPPWFLPEETSSVPPDPEPDTKAWPLSTRRFKKQLFRRYFTNRKKIKSTQGRFKI